MAFDNCRLPLVTSDEIEGDGFGFGRSCKEGYLVLGRDATAIPPHRLIANNDQRVLVILKNLDQAFEVVPLIDVESVHGEEDKADEYE